MDEIKTTVEPIVDEDFDDSDLVALAETMTDEELSNLARFGLPAEYRRPGRHETSGEPLGERHEFIRCPEGLVEVTELSYTQDERGNVARQVVTDGELVFEVDSQDVVPGTL